ncbi:protein FAM185A isoform X2 [Microtus pennsylvanicus]|uniref:protein FAM185A isoform X2 n=1 Tax=Microtus pennsylvanicus TaxID=10058 RepID=UPI003F6AECF5
MRATSAAGRLVRGSRGPVVRFRRGSAGIGSPRASEGVDAAGEPVRAAEGAAPVPPARAAPGSPRALGRRPRAGGGVRRGARGGRPGRPAGRVRRCSAGDGHPVRRHRPPGVGGDLNIESSGSGSVKVQNIECDRCEISTAQGASVLEAVKSQNLCVQTKGGNVICLGTVYGNIDIKASHHSSVTADKLQGSCVNIATEDGLLEVKYLYTESSFLSSAAGDIALGNVHGNIVLQSKKGNITVDSSSGCLKASSQQGAIDVYISQLEEVALTSQEGSITVKAPSSLRAYLKLSGKEVVVDADAQVHDMAKDHKGGNVTVTGLMNQARSQERWITAVAPKGTVSFKHQSWFQSLKLSD